MDGTLTSCEFKDGLHVVPTPGVQAAVRAFVEAGNVAVVCSGRSILNLEDLLRLPFSGFVTLDGTHVILDGEVIYGRTIARETFARTVDEMRRIGMDALPFSPARVFAFGLRASQHWRERALGEHGHAVHRAGERGVEATARERRVRVDLGLRVRHDDVVKFQALGHTQRQQHHTLGG